MVNGRRARGPQGGQQRDIVPACQPLGYEGFPSFWDGLTGAVDDDGVFDGRPEDFTDRACGGRVRWRRHRLVFAGRSLEINADLDMNDCGQLGFEARLSRP